MTIQLTELDYKVLNLIPASDGRITGDEIASILKISKRRVFACTERLKKKGVPIVADRLSENKGMYIAECEEERQLGLASLRNHAKAMEERISQVENAKLKTWKYDLQDPMWREKVVGTQKVEISGKVFEFSFSFDGDDTVRGIASIPGEAIEEIKKLRSMIEAKKKK